MAALKKAKKTPRNHSISDLLRRDLAAKPRLPGANRLPRKRAAKYLGVSLLPKSGFLVKSHVRVGIIQWIVCIIDNKRLNHQSWMYYQSKVLAVVNAGGAVERVFRLQKQQRRNKYWVFNVYSKGVRGVYNCE